MKQKNRILYRKGIGLLLVLIVIVPQVFGQKKNKKSEDQGHSGFPYADYVNGGGFGKGTIIGMEYYNDFGSEAGVDLVGYQINQGFSEHSYIGLKVISDGFYDPEIFFLDFEFPLYNREDLLITGFFGGATNSDFSSYLIFPGIKARFGTNRFNITFGYNPIIDVDNADAVFWSPFVLNRNAGLQLNGYFTLSESKFSLFMNNSLIFEDVFDMWASNTGVAIDLDRFRISPFIRNVYIKFFESTWDTVLGLSVVRKM
jgi:hypothetical protein